MTSACRWCVEGKPLHVGYYERHGQVAMHDVAGFAEPCQRATFLLWYLTRPQLWLAAWVVLCIAFLID